MSMIEDWRFYLALAVVALPAALLLYLLQHRSKLRAQLEPLPKLPCEHRYIQTRYTIQPDGKASGQAFCANPECRQLVNIDLVIVGDHSGYDGSTGFIYTGPLGRQPAPEVTPPEQVMVARKDLEVMLEKLVAVGPPKDCYSCQMDPDRPVCFSCLERARVLVELGFLRDALTGYLRA